MDRPQALEPGWREALLPWGDNLTRALVRRYLLRFATWLIHLTFYTLIFPSRTSCCCSMPCDPCGSDSFFSGYWENGILIYFETSKIYCFSTPIKSPARNCALLCNVIYSLLFMPSSRNKEKQRGKQMGPARAKWASYGANSCFDVAHITVIFL